MIFLLESLVWGHGFCFCTLILFKESISAAASWSVARFRYVACFRSRSAPTSAGFLQNLSRRPVIRPFSWLLGLCLRSKRLLWLKRFIYSLLDNMETIFILLIWVLIFHDYLIQRLFGIFLLHYLEEELFIHLIRLLVIGLSFANCTIFKMVRESLDWSRVIERWIILICEIICLGGWVGILLTIRPVPGRSILINGIIVIIIMAWTWFIGWALLLLGHRPVTMNRLCLVFIDIVEFILVAKIIGFTMEWIWIWMLNWMNNLAFEDISFFRSNI